MTSMLLLVSFILHIIALAAIFQLFKQIQLLKKDNPQDVMELFETYLEEIKEENRLLEKEIYKQDNHKDQALTKRNDTKKHEMKEENVYIPQAPDITDDKETSLQARILQLNSHGLTVDEIARRLGCGKTEAELIIKLRSKN